MLPSDLAPYGVAVQYRLLPLQRRTYSDLQAGRQASNSLKQRKVYRSYAIEERCPPSVIKDKSNYSFV